MHKKDIFMYAKLDVTYPSVLITSCDVYLIFRTEARSQNLENEFLAQHIMFGH